MSDVITIDGPGGSGKSTVSRILAKKIGYSYLDTGAMYRAVALAANRRCVDLSDGRALGGLCRSLDLHFLNEEDPPTLLLDQEDISLLIRGPELDMLSSGISSIREVREAMTTLQRKMAEGVWLVAEGRDMGTVVFPWARYKFYLSASPEVRAQRRYEELSARGETASKGLVEEELKKRDSQDRMRLLAPLKPAADAIIVDSTNLTIEEVIQMMLYHIGEK